MAYSYVHFPSTVRIQFDWDYPEPAVINYRLAKLQYSLDHPMDLMYDLKYEAIRDMENRFIDEEDPEGNKWEPLKRPAKNQVGILRLSEDMFHAATDENNWSSTVDSVFFDTGGLPKYWVFHEQPSRRMQRIPARPFVGLSHSAQMRMQYLAESWLNNQVDEAASGYEEPTFGASWGFSAAGEFTYGIELGSRGFVPVGRDVRGRFVSLKGL